MPSYNRKRGIVRYSDTGAGTAGFDSTTVSIYPLTADLVDLVSEGTATAEGTATLTYPAIPFVGNALFATGGTPSNLQSAATISGESNYTLEAFIRAPASVIAGTNSVGIGLVGSTDYVSMFSNSANTALRMTGSNLDTTATTDLVAGIFQHWCIMRSGGTLYGFIDGVQLLSGTVSGGTFGASATPEIGYRFDGSGGSPDIYRSYWRVSNAAIYSTSGFTPPSGGPITT